MRQLIVYFTIYSFLGWLSETIYCYIIDKKFTYRGFLYGPVCPIYGFGGVLVTILLRGMGSNPIKVFFEGMILASVLEYITSYILEKLFHMKWWDYSKHKFNINGRVCLLNSVLFGILSLVIVEVIEPMLRGIVRSIPDKTIYPLSAVITTIFIVDLIFTVAHLIHLKEHLLKIKNIKNDLRKLGVELEEFTESELEKLRLEIEKENNNENKDKIRNLIEKLNLLKKEAKRNRRILNAFPNAKHMEEHKHLNYLKNLINNK